MKKCPVCKHEMKRVVIVACPVCDYVMEYKKHSHSVLNTKPVARKKREIPKATGLSKTATNGGKGDHL